MSTPTALGDAYSDKLKTREAAWDRIESWIEHARENDDPEDLADARDTVRALVKAVDLEYGQFRSRTNKTKSGAASRDSAAGGGARLRRAAALLVAAVRVTGPRAAGPMFLLAHALERLSGHPVAALDQAVRAPAGPPLALDPPEPLFESHSELLALAAASLPPSAPRAEVTCAVAVALIGDPPHALSARPPDPAPIAPTEAPADATASWNALSPVHERAKRHLSEALLRVVQGPAGASASRAIVARLGAFFARALWRHAKNTIVMGHLVACAAATLTRVPAAHWDVLAGAAPAIIAALADWWAGRRLVRSTRGFEWPLFHAVTALRVCVKLVSVQLHAPRSREMPATAVARVCVRFLGAHSEDTLARYALAPCHPIQVAAGVHGAQLAPPQGSLLALWADGTTTDDERRLCANRWWLQWSLLQLRGQVYAYCLATASITAVDVWTTVTVSPGESSAGVDPAAKRRRTLGAPSVTPPTSPSPSLDLAAMVADAATRVERGEFTRTPRTLVDALLTAAAALQACRFAAARLRSLRNCAAKSRNWALTAVPELEYQLLDVLAHSWPCAVSDGDSGGSATAAAPTDSSTATDDRVAFASAAMQLLTILRPAESSGSARRLWERCIAGAVAQVRRQPALLRAPGTLGFFASALPVLVNDRVLAEHLGNQLAALLTRSVSAPTLEAVQFVHALVAHNALAHFRLSVDALLDWLLQLLRPEAFSTVGSASTNGAAPSDQLLAFYGCEAVVVDLVWALLAADAFAAASTSAAPGRNLFPLTRHANAPAVTRSGLLAADGPGLQSVGSQCQGALAMEFESVDLVFLGGGVSPLTVENAERVVSVPWYTRLSPERASRIRAAVAAAAASPDAVGLVARGTFLAALWTSYAAGTFGSDRALGAVMDDLLETLQSVMAAFRQALPPRGATVATSVAQLWQNRLEHLLVGRGEPASAKSPVKGLYAVERELLPVTQTLMGNDSRIAGIISSLGQAFPGSAESRQATEASFKTCIVDSTGRSVCLPCSVAPSPHQEFLEASVTQILACSEMREDCALALCGILRSRQLEPHVAGEVVDWLQHDSPPLSPGVRLLVWTRLATACPTAADHRAWARALLEAAEQQPSDVVATLTGVAVSGKAADALVDALALHLEDCGRPKLAVLAGAWAFLAERAPTRRPIALLQLAGGSADPLQTAIGVNALDSLVSLGATRFLDASRDALLLELAQKGHDMADLPGTLFARDPACSAPALVSRHRDAIARALVLAGRTGEVPALLDKVGLQLQIRSVAQRVFPRIAAALLDQNGIYEPLTGQPAPSDSAEHPLLELAKWSRMESVAAELAECVPAAAAEALASGHEPLRAAALLLTVPIAASSVPGRCGDRIALVLLHAHARLASLATADQLDALGVGVHALLGHAGGLLSDDPWLCRLLLLVVKGVLDRSPAQSASCVAIVGRLVDMLLAGDAPFESLDGNFALMWSILDSARPRDEAALERFLEVAASRGVRYARQVAFKEFDQELAARLDWQAWPRPLVVPLLENLVKFLDEAPVETRRACGHKLAAPTLLQAAARAFPDPSPKLLNALATVAGHVALFPPDATMDPSPVVWTLSWRAEPTSETTLKTSDEKLVASVARALLDDDLSLVASAVGAFAALERDHANAAFPGWEAAKTTVCNHKCPGSALLTRLPLTGGRPPSARPVTKWPAGAHGGEGGWLARPQALADLVVAPSHSPAVAVSVLAAALADATPRLRGLVPLLQLAHCTFARSVLPALAHVVLRGDAGNENASAARTALQAVVQRAFCVEKPAARPVIEALVDTLQHLRQQPLNENLPRGWTTAPGAATPAVPDNAWERNFWFPVEYALVGRVCIACGLDSAGLLFLELAASASENSSDALWSAMATAYERMGDPASAVAAQARQNHGSSDTAALPITGAADLAATDLRLQLEQLKLAAAPFNQKCRLLAAATHSGYASVAAAMVSKTAQAVRAASPDGNAYYAALWQLGLWDDATPVLGGTCLGQDALLFDGLRRSLDGGAGLPAGPQALPWAVGPRLVAKLLCQNRQTAPATTAVWPLAVTRTLDVAGLSSGTADRAQLWAAEAHEGGPCTTALSADLQLAALAASAHSDSLGKGHERHALETLTGLYVQAARAARRSGAWHRAQRPLLLAERALGDPSVYPDRQLLLVRVRAAHAKLQWAQGATSAAIQLQRSVVDSLKAPADAAVEHARALCRLGEWLAETRLERPARILEVYLRAAVGRLPAALRDPGLSDISFDGKSLRKASSVHHALAAYCAQQLSAGEQRDDETIAASLELLRSKAGRLAQVDEQLLAKPAARPGTDHQLDALRRTHRQLLAVLTTDMDDIETELAARETFRDAALENYLCALILGDAHDLCVYPFLTLWFQHAGAASASAAVARRLPAVPPPKIVPVFYQLCVRLQAPGADDSAFQQLLRAVLGRVALAHPGATAHHLLALANGADADARLAHDLLGVERNGRKPRTSSTPNAPLAVTAKAFAAGHLLRTLAQQSPAFAAFLTELAAVSAAYAELAAFRVPASAASQARPQSGLSAPGCILFSIRDMEHVPVLTAAGPEKDWPRIRGFAPRFHLVGGINVPKKILCHGTDGRTYPQLVKHGDDTRKEAVVADVFELVNRLLARDRRARRETLAMVTYRVVPLSSRAGILQWLDGTVPLGHWLCDAHTRYRPGDMHPTLARRTMLTEHERNGATLQSKRAVYDRIADAVQPVLRHFFLERFPEPAAWAASRRAYSRSVAVASIAGYVVGLGDRHLQNLLLGCETGTIAPIDLGIVFDEGRLLRTPELVPFRLTRDIIDGLGVLGTCGAFEAACAQTLEILRAARVPITALVQVFLHDPLNPWALHCHGRQYPVGELLRRAAAASSAAVAGAKADENQRPAGSGLGLGVKDKGRKSPSASAAARLARLAQWHARLSHSTAAAESDEYGASSGSSDAEDLLDDGPPPGRPRPASAQERIVDAQRALAGIARKLAPDLSCAAHVRELINTAQDPDRLCRMYVGWQAWL